MARRAPRVCLAACAAAAALLGAIAGAAEPPTPAVTAVPTAHGAILSGQLANSVFTQCSRSAPRDATADWVPTIADVDRLEERLPAFIAGLAPGGPGHPLGETRRQYVGFSRGGHRYIYVNAFPRHYSEDDPRPAFRDYWKRAPVVVCDGGDWFFGVEYDVETGSFSQYAANGAP